LPSFVSELFIKNLIGKIKELEGIEEETISDIKRKEGIFKEFKALPQYTKAKAIANVHTSLYFGNLIEPTKNKDTEDVYHGLVWAINGGEEEWRRKTWGQWFKQAQEMADQRAFFHWELEFPEIFFESGAVKENPGWDAVIGNPPYIDIKALDKVIVAYFFEAFAFAHWRVNIFASFIEEALDLARIEYGQVGLIIPTSFLTQVSYSPLRSMILQDYWLRKLVRLPNELFGTAAGEVKVDTCIFIVQKNNKVKDPKTEILIYKTFNRLNSISNANSEAFFEYPQQKWSTGKDSAIVLSGLGKTDLLEKIRSISNPLEELCEFCLGLTPYDKYTGHTEEQIKNKVFHANAQLAPTYRKLLKSGDVSRYLAEWNGVDWINYGNWLAAPREQRFFIQERILVQQIIDWSSLRIFAGLTDSEFYNT
jgi:hypothetical protein